MAQRSEFWAETLRDHIVKTPAAVGETGLDHWMRDYDFELQQAVLRRHLEFAAELGRPVTIHCLPAWRALLDLSRSTPRPSCGFLLHSYGGPLELVDSFVELGAYFSFSGYFLNENKKAKLAPFQEIPMERLLVFVMAGREFSLVMVGAIPTVAGYSINDEIVVFDRIREGLRSGRKGSIQYLMNASINETLSRTILTSGVALISMLSLLFFGSSALLPAQLSSACSLIAFFKFVAR